MDRLAFNRIIEQDDAPSSTTHSLPLPPPPPPTMAAIAVAKLFAEKTFSQSFSPCSGFRVAPSSVFRPTLAFDARREYRRGATFHERWRRVAFHIAGHKSTNPLCASWPFNSRSADSRGVQKRRWVSRTVRWRENVDHSPRRPFDHFRKYVYAYEMKDSSVYQDVFQDTFDVWNDQRC